MALLKIERKKKMYILFFECVNHSFSYELVNKDKCPLLLSSMWGKTVGAFCVHSFGKGVVHRGRAC